jgi:hypothetical protein
LQRLHSTWNTVPEKQRVRKLNTTSQHASEGNISHRGLKAEHTKKDKTLDEPAFGNVTWSLQHPKAGSRTDLRTKGTIIVLYEDTIQACHWYFYWIQHPEAAFIFNGAEQ